MREEAPDERREQIGRRPRGGDDDDASGRQLIGILHARAAAKGKQLNFRYAHTSRVRRQYMRHLMQSQREHHRANLPLQAQPRRPNRHQQREQRQPEGDTEGLKANHRPIFSEGSTGASLCRSSK